MTTEELRTRFLAQFTPIPLRKRSYEFHTHGPLPRIRNSKHTSLTSLESLTVLTSCKICCTFICITLFTTPQLICERVKYL
jgi:hypothetical protein